VLSGRRSAHSLGGQRSVRELLGDLGDAVDPWRAGAVRQVDPAVGVDAAGVRLRVAGGGQHQQCEETEEDDHGRRREHAPRTSDRERSQALSARLPLRRAAMATGWVYHELYMWHDTGRAAPPGAQRKWLQAWEHYENPETKRRFRNLIEVAGLFDDLVALKPRMATVDEILRFHTAAYVESIRAMRDASGGNAGEITPVGHGSFENALLAAGGTITAIDAVLEGRVRNAYALVRPPGHHAEADRGRGFCIFGNVVVAIEHARAKRGVARVATVDWDVHHGNG